MSFAQSFPELDGCRLHLRRGGAGEPLLFLHGASGAPVVLPFMEKLAGRFDVLVPEHPGYGLSGEPEWLENIHDLAYFYLDFLKPLDLRNLTVVGHSIGGWIAMEMAVRDASRMKTLVLASPAGIRAPGVQPADIFLMPPQDMEPATPEAIDLALKNRHTTARIAWEPRLHDPFLSKWLHRIDVPVKIVWGRDDPILPASLVHEYRRLMPRAEVHVFEATGHLPHVEKPDLFCEIVCR